MLAAGLGDGSVSFHDAVSQDCAARVWPHTKAVGHVEYASFAPGDCANQLVVTSSNDGLVLVLQVPAAAARLPVASRRASRHATPAVDEPMRVLYTVDHASGPNWMCTSAACGGAIIVADTSPSITVYTGVAEGVARRMPLAASRLDDPGKTPRK